MKLTEHKNFKELMRMWFKDRNKKIFPLGKRQRMTRETLENFMRNEETTERNRPMQKFYMNHIRRGATGIQELLKTKPSEYTRRKKRK